jgi:hypothetical protein
VEILTPDYVQAGGTNPADHRGTGFSTHQSQFAISTAQYQAHGVSPRMVVHAAIGVRRHEAVKIHAPAKGTRDIVPFQIRLPVVTVYPAARKVARDLLQ